MLIGSFANAQSIQEHLTALGIQDRGSEAFRPIFQFLDQLIAFEKYSNNQTPADTEITASAQIKENLHNAVLAVIEKNSSVQINAFKATITAIKNFNSLNSMGGLMFNLIQAQLGTHTNPLEQEQAQGFRYKEIQTIYSQYLSKIGLEPIKVNSNISFLSSNLQIPSDLSAFMDTVKLILMDDLYNPTSDKDRDLKAYVETLLSQLESIPAIQQDEFLQKELIDYFYDHYVEENSMPRINSESLAVLPSQITLNIQDGAKLLGFLKTIQLPVDEALKSALSKIEESLKTSFEDSFSKNIDPKIKQKRLNSLLSSITQIDAINKELKRLDLGNEDLDKLIHHGQHRTLREYVMVKNYRLSGNFYGFIICDSHLDESKSGSYQKHISNLVEGMTHLKSSDRGQELYRECHEQQIISLTEAVEQMTNYLEGNSAEWCGVQEIPIIAQKLQIAQSALKWLNENKPLEQ
jgi:hypothetical protein